MVKPPNDLLILRYNLPQNTMPAYKQQHRREVIAFLQKHFACPHWELALPHSSGKETYFARANSYSLFVKLGAPLEIYQAVAALVLTPPVLATGYLSDGASLLVQPEIAARKPTRNDFHTHLDRFASILHALHTSSELKRLLPSAPSDQYRQLGLQALARVQQKWSRYRAQVAAVAGFVDAALDNLRQQIQDFSSAGPVASHQDPCNANWLVAESSEIYLIDFDSLALDDPALDLGAILWWYYPPDLRPRFLEMCGYAFDEGYQQRMRVRMALHCLDILLPRERSFDRFEQAAFDSALTDFRAALAGEENPQGYDE